MSEDEVGRVAPDIETLAQRLASVDYLVDAVFNYPTLAEAYKVAALDATNKMRQIARFA